MTLKDLKTQIELKSVTNELIIFKETNSNFISNQYISAISDVTGKQIRYVDSLDELIVDATSIFPTFLEDIDSSLNVLKSEVFMWEDPRINDLKDTIIVVSKFSDSKIEKMFTEHIVDVPKIEDWMLKDYIYSIAEGVEHKKLDWLMQLCGNNIDRLQSEVDKITLFTVPERRYLFDDMIHDGAVDDLSSYNIFNFTNAIVSKDISALRPIYQELKNIDTNEFGLLSILVKNFRNLIMVQLNPNPTPESTGMDSKQLYAIKRLPRAYSASQLVDIYKMLLRVDKQIKSGELPTEILIDYLLVKLLSV